MAEKQNDQKKTFFNARNAFFLVIGILIVAFAVFYISKLQNSNNNAKSLAKVEIRQYKGAKLSSVNDIVETSIKGPQNVNVKTYSLLITGLVNKEKKYNYDQIISGHQAYKKVVQLNCVEGWSVNLLWQGVLVKDLLNEAGTNPKANTVIFYAADGYTTSLPLSYIINNNILLAYKINGTTLTPATGFPFQVVAESKLGYKWAKWVTKIELSSNNNYQGYWESRGYSNNADVNGGGY